MPPDRLTAGDGPAGPWRGGWMVPAFRPEAENPARAALSPPRTAGGAAIAVGWGLPRTGEPRRARARRPVRAVTDPSPSDHQPVPLRP